VLPAQLRKNHIRELQQRLLRDDQSIRKVTNKDPDDLARIASVSASDHLEGAEPLHIIDGKVRDVPTQWDHRWGAKAIDGGQWIELAWDDPVLLDEVQITFDSGFHRQLTLSASDGASRNIIRGPQPEMVKDYQISFVDDSGARQGLVDIEGNYLRLRRHRFAAIQLRSLRLHALTTHATEQIRVFEIRCYSRKE
jgi:hypothetical protein